MYVWGIVIELTNWGEGFGVSQSGVSDELYP